MSIAKTLTKKEQIFFKDELKLIVSENLSTTPFILKLSEILKPVETQIVFEKKISNDVILIKTKANDVFDSQEVSLKSVMLRYNDANDFTNYNNRLCVIYLSHDSLDMNKDTLNDRLKEYCKLKEIIDAKILFIFEKVEEQIKLFSNENMISLEDFRDMIFNLQFEDKIEYEHSEHMNSSVELILAFLTIFCKKRNNVRSNLNPLDSVKISDNSKSKLMGVENGLSLMWVI